MHADSKATAIRSLDRINPAYRQRPSPKLTRVCGNRLGQVCRNTWIAEAADDKLRRERTGAAPLLPEHRAHG